VTLVIDLSSSKWGHGLPRITDILPANFQLATLFRSRLRARRWTDGRRPSTLYAPSHGGGSIIVINCIIQTIHFLMLPINFRTFWWKTRDCTDNSRLQSYDALNCAIFSGTPCIMYCVKLEWLTGLRDQVNSLSSAVSILYTSKTKRWRLVLLYALRRSAKKNWPPVLQIKLEWCIVDER